MSGFLTDLDVRKIGANRWRLTSPLRYEVAPSRIIEVPAGFYTDFASIPRFMYLTTPPIGAYDAAAVLHDYLYFAQATTRAQADGIFRQAMADSGVSTYTRTKMWLAVRVFGGGIWERYAKDKEEAT